MRNALKMKPVEYIYGLQQVELRPRVEGVGDPFGYYDIDAKHIILYSLPLIWRLPRASDELTGLVPYGANVEREESVMTITWTNPEDLAAFFYCNVFTHELGHHYSHQWRRKRKTPPFGRAQETVADLHTRKLHARWRSRR